MANQPLLRSSLMGPESYRIRQNNAK